MDPSMTTVSGERRPRGLILILAATAAAGVSGYAIQILAPAMLEDADAYLTFSAFWSILFLLGSAVGGIQQEVARATSPAGPRTPHRSIRRFTIASAVVVVALSAAVGLIVGSAALGPGHLPIVGALVIGLLGYVITAVATGLFYGLGALGFVAALITVDAALRGVAVVAGLLLGAPIDTVAYLVALPFGIAVLFVWQFARSRVVGRYTLDASDGVLARHSLSTVVAAASIGVMVTGMPLLFRVTLGDLPAVAVASLTLVVTLTRAPFIIPLMALQSYLVVGFRGSPKRARARVRAYLLIALAAGALAALIAIPVGPWVVEVISAGRYATDGFTSAMVVMSAILVGCMCITGPALLAEARHGAYASGWVIAAGGTIGSLLLIPVNPDVRALLALVGAPIAGLAVHGACLAVRRAGKPDAEV